MHTKDSPKLSFNHILILTFCETYVVQHENGFGVFDENGNSLRHCLYFTTIKVPHHIIF